MIRRKFTCGKLLASLTTCEEGNFLFHLSSDICGGADGWKSAFGVFLFCPHSHLGGSGSNSKYELRGLPKRRRSEGLSRCSRSTPPTPEKRTGQHQHPCTMRYFVIRKVFLALNLGIEQRSTLRCLFSFGYLVELSGTVINFVLIYLLVDLQIKSRRLSVLGSFTSNAVPSSGCRQDY